MTQEALKLALYALEYHTAQTRPIHQTNEAITAIKEALAQPEQPHRAGFWCVDLTCNNCYSSDFRFKHTNPPQRTEPKVCCQQYDTCLEPCTPRGRHLAQRTWVGLTDEDISEIVRGTHNTGSFVRAIEAKLKEKNT